MLLKSLSKRVNYVMVFFWEKNEKKGEREGILILVIDGRYARHHLFYVTVPYQYIPARQAYIW